MNLLLAGVAGCFLGIAYFEHLWRSVQTFVGTGHASFRRSAGFRLAGIGIGLVMLGRTGEGNLVAALVGVYAARYVLVWRVGRVSSA